MNQINELDAKTWRPARCFGSSFRGGFTLIELLVVVLIIGILAAVALPQYEKAVLKTRIQQQIVILRAVAHAQEAFYLANGFYASLFSELDIEVPKPDRSDIIGSEDTYFYKNFHCSMAAASANNSGGGNTACALPSWDIMRLLYAHNSGAEFGNRSVLLCNPSDTANGVKMRQVLKSLGFTERKPGESSLYLLF